MTRRPARTPALAQAARSEASEAFPTALAAESTKLARSPTGRLVAALLAVAVPVMAAGLVAAAERGGSSQLALKVRPLVQGSGWEALAGVTGQVLSISMLLEPASS